MTAEGIVWHGGTNVEGDDQGLRCNERRGAGVAHDGKAGELRGRLWYHWTGCD